MEPTRDRGRVLRRRPLLLGAGLALVAAVALGAAWLVVGGGGSAARTAAPGHPAFGPNVYVFRPGMRQSRIEATVNSIARRQARNQFGTQRYALLFEPGTYGSAASPMFLQVGYYTSVAGLGRSPGDVVINGAVDSFNRCFPAASTSNCTALLNSWRSLSNLTIDLPAPPAGAPCQDRAEFWAASQAAPVRRVQVNGFTALDDYCSRPGYSSGGFIADSAFTGGTVLNGSQQQFLVRNSALDGWSNGVWNQVFCGDVGAPAQNFGSGGQYTTLTAAPVTAEEPFLDAGRAGNYQVFVPAAQRHAVGPAWAHGPVPGKAVPIQRLFIAVPGDPAGVINAALAQGRDLILTPGVYQLAQPLEITRPGTVVLGLGFPTLVPVNGSAAMRVASVPGVRVSGMIFDAGPVNSPVLLQVGSAPGRGAASPADPTVVQDVSFRVGGATPGRATDSLVVNSSQVILDDVWAWRADHGNGVSWAGNAADTGVVVNGDNVTSYGLFVEHYQKAEVIWNGRNGTNIFFQNEMPYDPPSQAAWKASAATDGYPAFLITRRAAGFSGYGMGSYSFFDRGVPLSASSAFQTERPPGSQLHDLLTVFLSTAGSGGIDHVVNGVGRSSTAANPDTPVNVVSYP